MPYVIDVSQELEDIRLTPYGKTMRPALHSSIYKLSQKQNQMASVFDQLIIDAGNSNAEVVAARVDKDGNQFAQLTDRLNNNEEEVEILEGRFDTLNQEVIDARTDKNGVVNVNLKQRLDKVDIELERKANKLDNVIYIEDFRGNFNDTELFKHILTVLKDNTTLILSKDTYSVDETINFDGFKNIKIQGKTIISETINKDSVFYFNNCENVVVSDLICNGSEKIDGFQGSVNDDFSFIYFNNCNRIEVNSVTITNKTYGIILNQSSETTINNININGFLLTGSIVDNGANYNAGVLVKRSTNTNISNLTVRNVGNAILIGFDSSYISMDNIYIYNSRDNGIYISSGTNCTINNANVFSAISSGIKARGRNHLVENCKIENCLIGVTFSGNGAILDADGYNGGYSTLKNTIIKKCTEIGVNLDVQDGNYGRNYIIENNIIEDIECTTVNSAYLAGVRSTDTIVKNNTFIGTNNVDFTILITALGSKSDKMCISNNIIKTATRYAMRLVDVTNSEITNNIMNNQNGVDGRTLTNCIIDGNIATGVVVNLSDAYNSTGNILTKNIGSNINCNYSLNLASHNKPDFKNASASITLAPNFIGQTTISSGNLYIAKGTASSADWLFLG